MRPTLLLPIALLAPACETTPRDFPSLAVRSIESRSDADPVAVADEVAADPAASGRIATLEAEATAAAQAFDAALAGAEARVAAAGDEGSDSWVAAQLAVNGLAASRATLATNIAEIDAILIAEYGANRPVPPDAAGATDRLQPVSDRQAATLRTLTDRLVR